ncbi:MAG: glycosyltransferase family 4 protein [Chloroflexi bacterium]|nr:glycosyltransferase family 4 protein [Chloroflexota bacterium]
MHIVMFSINPLFPDRVMGGAPKQLQKVAIHLGESGHSVTVLCTRPLDSPAPFRWQENALVKPILRFKQPFPQPYAAPAYDIANAFHDVAAHLQTADRFYMHDGEFLFPFAYQHVPTVVSLRDNVYPETILGGFLFQGDTLIAISDYSRRFYLHTMGRFFPDLAERLIVVPNGVDWQQYHPTPPDEILRLIPVNPADDLILLHPHRPEPDKGLAETIALADLLVHHYGLTNLKVLSPRWLAAGLSPEVAAFYANSQQEIAGRGLEGHFFFHDWVPQALMPQYYSLGHLTVSLGSFVESFGNTVYESLGCGTPALATRVSTHRELLPDDLLPKVHVGDIAAAAALAADILRERRRTPPATLAYLHQHYGMEGQLAGYAAAILTAQRRGPLPYRFTPLTEDTRYRLSPWCYEWADGFYHDFLARHQPIPRLSALLRDFPDGFTAVQSGVSPAELDEWYRLGYVTPGVREEELSGGRVP